MIELLEKDFLEKGTRLFGEDRKKWKFTCCNCGNTQSIEDFEKIGISANEAGGYVYFSCIGRFIPDSKGTMSNEIKPCNYTIGGLFNLAKVCIVTPDGEKHPMFELDNLLSVAKKDCESRTVLGEAEKIIEKNLPALKRMAKKESEAKK